jgi:hypothetical protein
MGGRLRTKILHQRPATSRLPLAPKPAADTGLLPPVRRRPSRALRRGACACVEFTRMPVTVIAACYFSSMGDRANDVPSLEERPVSARFTSSEVLVREFLVIGRDDYVYLAELLFYARQLGASLPENERRSTLDAVKELLERRLWKVGELSAEGFREWPSSIPRSLARIEDEWRATSRELLPGDICWFANTPEGDAAADAVLADGFESVADD